MRHHPSLTEGTKTEPGFFKGLAWFFLTVSGAGIAVGFSPLGERAGWALAAVLIGALGCSLGCYFIHSVQVATRGGAALLRAQAMGVEFPMPARGQTRSHAGPSENPN
jgi:hypothetical protein